MYIYIYTNIIPIHIHTYTYINIYIYSIWTEPSLVEEKWGGPPDLLRKGTGYSPKGGAVGGGCSGWG